MQKKLQKEVSIWAEHLPRSAIHLRSGSLKEMLQRDEKAREEAIALYKQTIRVVDKESDSTTRRLFEDILADEEEHHATFTGLLEK